MLVLRLAWRNGWRNPRRSLLSIGAVAVAFAVLLTLESLREGLARQLLDTGTGLMLAHVQVHDAAYLPDRSVHDTLGGARGVDLPAALARVTRTPGVVAAAPRVLGFALASTDERSAGIRLLGVDPGREARVSRLLGALVEGESLAGAPARAVLLGRTLAEELGAGPGAEVAVVTQAADGSLGNDLFRVRGVFATGLAALDRGLAVVTIGDAQALLALAPGRIHEIAVRVDDPQRARAVARDLTGRGALPSGARVDAWEALAPALVEYVRLLGGWTWVMVAIVGVFAASGVLNTMLMAVFERTREVGVLAALGLRPSRILAMVVAESLWLSLAGVAAGAGLGALGMAYFAWHGWDLSRWAAGLTIAGALVDPVLRGALTWRAAPSMALALTALNVAAALLPAVRAARMRPVEALAAPVE